MNQRRERLRSHQSVPLTWEIPTLLAAATLLVLAVVPLVIQALALLLTTGAFAWPVDHELAALRAICHGRFGVGLTQGQRQALPNGPVLLAGSVIAQVLLVAACACTVLVIRGGHTAGHGLAGRVEAASLLGVRELRRKSRVIRPDLHQNTRLHLRRDKA